MEEFVRHCQLEKQSTCFENLFETGAFSDLTIFCKDGGMIKAHKNLLSSLSQTFNRLLQQGDSSPKSIELPWIKQSVLKMIIRFLYTANVPEELNDNIELVKEVLEASFYLQATHLFDYCKKMILGYLQKESVIELWSVLEPFKQQDGELEVVNFILGHLSEVAQTNDFNQLSADQMRKLAHQADKNQFNDDFVEFCIKWAKSDPELNEERLAELSNLIRIIGTDAITDDLLLKLFEQPWIQKLPELYSIAIGRMMMKFQQKTKTIKIHFFDFSSKKAQTYNKDVKKWCKLVERPTTMELNDCKYVTVCSLANSIYRKFRDGRGLDVLLQYDITENECSSIPIQNGEFKWAPIVGFGTCIYMWNQNEFIRYDPENKTLTRLAHLSPTGQGRGSLRASKGELFLRLEGEENIYSYNIQNDKWDQKTSNSFLKTCLKEGFCCGKWYFFDKSSIVVAVYDPQRDTWERKPFPAGQDKRLIAQSLDLPFLIFKEKSKVDGSSLEGNDDSMSNTESQPTFWLYYPSSDMWEKISKGLQLDGRAVFCDVTVT